MAKAYTRTVRDFSGIGGGEVRDAENLIRLWQESGDEPPLSTVPGYRKLTAFTGSIQGIYRFGNLMVQGRPIPLVVVHAGRDLHIMTDEGKLMASVKNALIGTKICCFKFGEWLYFIDGYGYYELRIYASSSGEILPQLRMVSEYIPLVCAEGKPLEQKNFFADHYYEQLTIGDPGIYAVGSESLEYAVINGKSGEAAVVDGRGARGAIVIPPTVWIDGACYRVTEIADNAFYTNGEISSVTIGSEVRRIGVRAFCLCTRLETVVTNGALSLLDVYAFAHCYALQTVYLGEALETVRRGAFHECRYLTRLMYGGADLMGEVTVEEGGNASYLNATVYNDSILPSVEPTRIRCPLASKGLYVSAATLGGQSISMNEGDVTYDMELEGDHTKAIILTAKDPKMLRNKLLEMEVFEITKHPDYDGDGYEMIFGCTIAAVYDGRIFLGGNPALPGTVFYSARTRDGKMHPGYFGIYNYFRDGEGGTVGLTATPDALYVFAGEREGCGIFRHTPAEGENDIVARIYPSSRGYLAEGAYRSSILYRDELILLSSRGVFAITHRNSAEDTELCPRDEGFSMIRGCSAEAKLGIWLGYLAVIDETKILLGDGRRMHRTTSGGLRYEWWRIGDICGYGGDSPVYRYAFHLPDGAEAAGITLAPKELRGERIPGKAVSVGGCLAEENEGKLFAICDSGERQGGLQYAIRSFLAEGDQLRFGCGNGIIYRFSTDKLGRPPSSADMEYNLVELKQFAINYPRYLAPEWYSFAGHPITSRLITKLDDCGYPTHRKTTETKSTVLELSAMKFGVEALTSEGEGTALHELVLGSLDFDWFVFGELAFTDGMRAPIVFRENTKKWHRKQYVITASGVEAPLEIRGIGYLFSVVGKVKG